MTVSLNLYVEQYLTKMKWNPRLGNQPAINEGSKYLQFHHN